MVRKHWLIITNGILWFVAGFNIARIGVRAAFEMFDLFFSLGLCGIGIFIAMGMFVATKALTKGFIRYLKFNITFVKGGLKHE